EVAEPREVEGVAPAPRGARRGTQDKRVNLGAPYRTCRRRPKVRIREAMEAPSGRVPLLSERSAAVTRRRRRACTRRAAIGGVAPQPLPGKNRTVGIRENRIVCRILPLRLSARVPHAGKRAGRVLLIHS